MYKNYDHLERGGLFYVGYSASSVCVRASVSYSEIVRIKKPVLYSPPESMIIGKVVRLQIICFYITKQLPNWSRLLNELEVLGCAVAHQLKITFLTFKRKKEKTNLLGMHKIFLLMAKYKIRKNITISFKLSFLEYYMKESDVLGSPTFFLLLKNLRTLLSKSFLRNERTLLLKKSLCFVSSLRR